MGRYGGAMFRRCGRLRRRSGRGHRLETSFWGESARRRRRQRLGGVGCYGGSSSSLRLIAEDYDMKQSLDVMPRVRIASPCPMRWEDLVGDERVRHCDRCRLNVYNIVGLSAAEAGALIRSREGSRLCLRAYRRSDGTLTTRDCPAGLAAIRRRCSTWLAGAVALLAVCLGALARTARPTDYWGEPLRLRAVEPLRALADRLRPPPRPLQLGDVCLPVPPITRGSSAVGG